MTSVGLALAGQCQSAYEQDCFAGAIIAHRWGMCMPFRLQMLECRLVLNQTGRMAFDVLRFVPSFGQVCDPISGVTNRYILVTYTWAPTLPKASFWHRLPFFFSGPRNGVSFGAQTGWHPLDTDSSGGPFDCEHFTDEPTGSMAIMAVSLPPGCCLARMTHGTSDESVSRER